MALNYSKYQKAVFDEIEHGVSNIVIEASAGSAKTTTIIKSLDYIPEDKQILFIAFNTSIVSELKEKIGNKPNIKVCTMHSLGRSLIQQHGYSVELQTNKYDTFITNNSLFANLKLKLKSNIIYGLIKNIRQLISLSRNNMARTEKQIKAIADRYNISLKYGESKIVKEALEWGKTHIDCIDFDDMIWLPNVLNLVPKYVKYDYIFLDEAQDANNAQIEMFMKFRRNGTRMIAVGDKDQSIYNFRGVDGTTFDKLKAMPNTKTLPLSISYRCPKKIVKYAQKFSQNIEAWDEAIDGEINYNVQVNDIKDNSMVLCRNNAPLAFLYLTLISQNKQAFICGNDDIFGKLRSQAEETQQKYLSAKRTKDGFIPELYRNLFDTKDKWCTDYQKTENDIFNSRMFRNMYDIVRTAEILSQGIHYTSEFIDRMNELINNEAEGIRLSTVHKAKGMEADDVYILCDSLMPSQYATSDWEIDEERHIQYVAYTRAKKTLNFIDEDDFGNFSEPKSKFAERMHNLEKEINQLTGRKSTIDRKLKYVDKNFASVIVTSAQTAMNKEKEEEKPVYKEVIENTSAVKYGSAKRRKAQKR